MWSILCHIKHVNLVCLSVHSSVYTLLGYACIIKICIYMNLHNPDKLLTSLSLTFFLYKSKDSNYIPLSICVLLTKILTGKFCA